VVKGVWILHVAVLSGTNLSHNIPSGIDWPSTADENKPKVAVILKDNLSHNVVAHLKQANAPVRFWRAAGIFLQP
jgi:hypothetical protein